MLETEKNDHLIPNCMPYYDNMKTIKHLLLVMIFCKTNFAQSSSVLKLSSKFSIH